MGSREPLYSSPLKELRTEKHLKQVDVSGIIQCTLKTYRSWEKGYVYPEGQSLIKLSKLFEVSADYILGLNPCRHVGNKEIREATGLTENCIEVLRFINSPPKGMSAEVRGFNQKTLIMVNLLLQAERDKLFIGPFGPDDNNLRNVFTEMYDYVFADEAKIEYLGSNDGTIPRYYNNRDLLKEMRITQIRKLLDACPKEER